MKQYVAEGHFAAGSMGPKVSAAVAFIESGGKEAIITQLRCAMSAIDGKTGTHILRVVQKRGEVRGKKGTRVIPKQGNTKERKETRKKKMTKRKEERKKREMGDAMKGV